jgi:hypothetical protein
VDGYFEWLIDQHNQHALDGRKVFRVGINQGSMLDANNYIYRSASGLPTTADEIKDKILDNLGGYVFLRYDGDEKIIDLYADVHETNAQIIDFGQNITDYERTISGEDMYTAVRPTGNAEETDGEEEGEKASIAELPDGAVEGYPSLTKAGDVIYSVADVTRYGYRETVAEFDSTDPSYLLTAGCKALNKCLAPAREIEIKAVDLSLYMDGYKPLEVGQVARARIAGRDIDEYLLVSKITLDLANPANDTYTLGDVFESLTGKQSSYVQALNASINKNVDAVAALDTSLKATAQVAQEASDTAAEANTNAINANTTAAAAQAAATSTAKDHRQNPERPARPSRRRNCHLVLRWRAVAE